MSALVNPSTRETRCFWKLKIISIDSATVDAIIEEVWVNGQQKDVWCRSGIPITDVSIYSSGEVNKESNVPSCYYVYMAKLISRNSLKECGPDGQTQAEAFCLCM